nr:nucleoid occlusion factor SlmA [Comamonas jiangduensis]
MSVSEVLSPLTKTAETVVANATLEEQPRTRKRPKPGERREQILQALAAMLESPAATASPRPHWPPASVSEAALYRHFASKAQMFEGLIDFIEQSVFSLVQQVAGRDGEALKYAPKGGARRAARIVALVLQFGERTPDMVRVLVGDALLLEHDRLQARMNQFFDRIESTLRQCLRPAAGALGSAMPTVDAQVAASVLMSFVQGRLQRFVRTGFRRQPTEHLDASLAMMI